MPIYISYFYKNVSFNFVLFCIVLYRVVSFFAPISCFNIILFYAYFVIFFDFWAEITLNKSNLLRNTSHFHTCLSLAKTSKIAYFYLSFESIRTNTPLRRKHHRRGLGFQFIYAKNDQSTWLRLIRNRINVIVSKKYIIYRDIFSKYVTCFIIIFFISFSIKNLLL